MSTTTIRVQMADLKCFVRLVIMTLVDLAHGKPRHVPYRDSRLTFLLQVRYTKFYKLILFFQ